MTFGELYDQFLEETGIDPKNVNDWRPCGPPYCDFYIQNAIIIWFNKLEGRFKSNYIIYIDRGQKGYFMDESVCCVCHANLEKDYIHIVYYNEYKEENTLQRSYVDSRNICNDCCKELFLLLKNLDGMVKEMKNAR